MHAHVLRVCSGTSLSSTTTLPLTCVRMYCVNHAGPARMATLLRQLLLPAPLLQLPLKVTLQEMHHKWLLLWLVLKSLQSQTTDFIEKSA